MKIQITCNVVTFCSFLCLFFFFGCWTGLYFFKCLFSVSVSSWPWTFYRTFCFSLSLSSRESSHFLSLHNRVSADIWICITNPGPLFPGPYFQMSPESILWMSSTVVYPNLNLLREVNFLNHPIFDYQLLKLVNDTLQAGTSPPISWSAVQWFVSREMDNVKWLYTQRIKPYLLLVSLPYEFQFLFFLFFFGENI